jgi:tetratricopeptide (TPR) repeat protein
LLALAAVAAVAIALYARAATFGFTYLDDDALIAEQEQRDFLAQPSSIWRAFTRPYFATTARDHAFYRPLVTASFALDARWSGASPRAYHVTNVALHAVAACLMFLLLRRFGHGDGLALGGALAFAAHPALATAVAWIPARPDLLLGVSALAAWLCFARAWEPGRWGSRIGHAAALLAALLAKETAVVLPAVFIAHALVVDRRPLRKLAAPWLLVGWAAAAGAYFVARRAVLEGWGTAGVSAGRAVANASLFVTSLGKLVFPIKLSVLATPEDSLLWPGIIAAALLAGALFVRGIRRPQLAFALGCFVAFVAPSLPASTLLALESRLYLPAVAVLLAACEVARLFRWEPSRVPIPSRDELRRAKPAFALRAPPLPLPIRAAVGGVVIAAFAVVSFVHAGNCRDRRTFAEAAVRGSPRSSLAHRNLGVTLHLAGEIDAARREYHAALAEDAGETIAHNNLAVILMSEGRLAQAEQHLRAELAINPRYAIAHRNLGLVLRALGRMDEASREMLEARSLEIKRR